MIYLSNTVTEVKEHRLTKEEKEMYDLGLQKHAGISYKPIWN